MMDCSTTSDIRSWKTAWGYLWISSNRGIQRVNKRTLEM